MYIYSIINNNFLNMHILQSLVHKNKEEQYSNEIQSQIHSAPAN